MATSAYQSAACRRALEGQVFTFVGGGSGWLRSNSRCSGLRSGWLRCCVGRCSGLRGRNVCGCYGLSGLGVNTGLLVGLIHAGSSLLGRHGLPSANAIVPTALILVGIDVNAYGIDLINLQVHLCDAVCAKHFKHAAAWTLFNSFQHVGLQLPRLSGSLAGAFTRLKSRNNLSCNFHIRDIVISLRSYDFFLFET